MGAGVVLKRGCGDGRDITDCLPKKGHQAEDIGSVQKSPKILLVV